MKRVFPAQKKFRLVPLLQNGLVHILMTWFTWLIWIAWSIKCFFSGRGFGVNIQFIIRFMHHTVYILTTFTNFVLKTSKKLAFSIKVAIVLESFSAVFIFLCEYSVLCVSVKGFEHKTGWESKKSSPLAHDTHFAELWQRIEEKRAKMWQRREYRWALVLVVWPLKKFWRRKVGQSWEEGWTRKKGGSYKWAFVWELWDGRQLFPLRALCRWWWSSWSWLWSWWRQWWSWREKVVSRGPLFFLP